MGKTCDKAVQQCLDKFSYNIFTRAIHFTLMHKRSSPCNLHFALPVIISGCHEAELQSQKMKIVTFHLRGPIVNILWGENCDFCSVNGRKCFMYFGLLSISGDVLSNYISSFLPQSHFSKARPTASNQAAHSKNHCKINLICQSLQVRKS